MVSDVSDTSFALLKRDASLLGDVDDQIDFDEDEPLEGIRCPLCRWHPSPSSRWSCLSIDGPEPPFPACGAVWNTFATRGRCPGCAHQWRWTSCLRCGEWSRHEDWYDRNESV
jgi:hypothetical protein